LFEKQQAMVSGYAGCLLNFTGSFATNTLAVLFKFKPIFQIFIF